MVAQFGLVTTTLVGHWIDGGTSSGVTFTLKQQPGPVAPAEQQTVVVPGRKTLPEGGLQVTDGAVGEQLLVTVTVNVTTTPVGEAQVTKMSGGQVICGLLLQMTVTLKTQRLLLPEESTAVHVIVVVPQGKALGMGVQLTVGFGSQ